MSEGCSQPDVNTFRSESAGQILDNDAGPTVQGLATARITELRTDRSTPIATPINNSNDVDDRTNKPLLLTATTTATTMDAATTNEDLILSSPRGLDPLRFSISLFVLLILFVLYLLLPKGVRKQYFRAYPKRHTWSARSRPINGGGNSNAAAPSSSLDTPSSHSQQQQQHYEKQMGSGMIPLHHNNQHYQGQQGQQGFHHHHNPEVMVSAAMQQLRSPGVLIVAHGSRGKPKTVRLQLTDTSITWRTESSRSNSNNNKKKNNFGKLHAVPLSAVMYVDVGKQTTALRRVENAAVQEALCFSLLTKEGSLDLEASSVAERDALVSCFSLVLDEVHAQNWRDIYRGPSSDLPSSFDEMDAAAQQQQQLLQQQQQQAAQSQQHAAALQPHQQKQGGAMAPHSGGV